jgi:hypothetical protein
MTTLRPALLTFKDWLDANGYVYTYNDREHTLFVSSDVNAAKAYAADAYSWYARNWHRAEKGE